jgi:hypothetical protein
MYSGVFHAWWSQQGRKTKKINLFQKLIFISYNFFSEESNYRSNASSKTDLIKCIKKLSQPKKSCQNKESEYGEISPSAIKPRVILPTSKYFYILPLCLVKHFFIKNLIKYIVVVIDHLGVKSLYSVKWYIIVHVGVVVLGENELVSPTIVQMKIQARGPFLTSPLAPRDELNPNG